ncbi:MAG: acetyl-CoA acetyltransferase [Gammaproteobacteria bacterium AqS3]|nr:acetyl-CoA acetyltransferase [Gammaproteobacteria bacterium AqS3]
MSTEANTPVLVGCGEFTDRSPPADGLSPVQIMQRAADAALADTGGGGALLRSIDCIGVVGMVTDSPNATLKTGDYRNLPRALGRSIGAPQGIHPLYTSVGGNSPQLLVNTCAERIAAGEFSAVLLSGCEVLRTLVGRLKAGIAFDDWRDEEVDDREFIGSSRDGVSEYEARHGMSRPTHIYPLFETALRAHYGRSVDEHQAAMGRLFEGFNAVAAENPNSWFGQRRSGEDIARPGPENRWVGYPYPKYLNSVIQVNMSAALVLCSVEAARAAGIAEERWVYLHGCSDLHENWFVSERESLHSAPALGAMARQALDMAGIGAGQLDHLDIYSCFPSAVQVACDEIGLDRERPLTLTGGLPYFGGPGNNYSMHGIAAAMRRCREQPGSWALSTANGWYLTKHACGIYSTRPFAGDWRRPRSLQSDWDRSTVKVPLDETPHGSFTVEAYTLVHGREGAELGLFVGRTDQGARALAQLDISDQSAWRRWMEHEAVGVRGTVTPGADGVNRLELPPS